MVPALRDCLGATVGEIDLGVDIRLQVGTREEEMLSGGGWEETRLGRQEGPTWQCSG